MDEAYPYYHQGWETRTTLIEEQRLAAEGGIPVRKEFLPYHRPSFGLEEERALVDVLRSGWVTTGQKTKLFEQEFAKYCGAKHAIGLNSCTAALHLALLSLNVGKDDEVITSPITFAATANVIEHVGARPVFVDVEPETLNIDVTKIEEKITGKTKAIIPVHFAGEPCKINEIKEIANRHNIFVIEDAAHAIEAIYNTRKIGSIGLFTAFSFYATKNITTGEGGILTTNDNALADKIRILSLHGISKDAWKRYSNDGYKHWEIIYPGYKYNMFDIQSALGLEQLKKIKHFWKKRERITGIYNDVFSKYKEIQLLKHSNNTKTKSGFHLYVLVLKTEDLNADRDTIMNTIQQENVGIGIHFRAVHLHPYYSQKYGFERGMLSKAEYASDRVISLPLYPGLEDSDVQDVIKVVGKVITHFRRK